MAKIQVKLVRSPIGRPQKQHRVLEALGLRKLQQVKVHNDSPGLRGQLKKVSHLVTIEELEA